MEERLQKILARAGYGSRRKCEELIQFGQVKVNGKVAELGIKVDPAKDTVTVDGKKIKLEEFNYRYIALNKPKNILSDCDSFGERKTVHDIVNVSEHMFAVGRLDFDSEGLILLTNDGDLANKLTHPRYGHEKEYNVKVTRRPDEKQLTTWRRGVVMEDGYRTAPAVVQVTKTEAEYAWLKVILKEGRKRQIREVGQLIGLPVARIIRVRIGTLYLGEMKPGEWRDLTESEVKKLKSSAGSVRKDNRSPSNARTMSNRYKPSSSTQKKEETNGPKQNFRRKTSQGDGSRKRAGSGSGRTRK
jgi:23S rRNA pseudouridine2605 synthase